MSFKVIIFLDINIYNQLKKLLFLCCFVLFKQ